MAQTYRTERSALHNAIGRCHDENNLRYCYYGARGIEVADIYRDPITGFDSFFDEVGPRPGEGYTLERLNNMLGYQPGNIAWVTHKENCQNRRPCGSVFKLDLGEGFKRNSPLVTHNGKKQSVSEWASELGLKVSTLRDRFKRGWSTERCLNPVLLRGRKA